LFILGDESVVYAHHQQKIFALNTTATYLWCLIEEERTKDTLLQDYATAFGIAEAAASAQVAAALEGFHDIGLIDLPDRKARPAPPPSRPLTDNIPPYAMPPLREGPIVAQRSYRLLETNFVVRYSDMEQVRWVDPILKNFAVSEAVETAMVVDLRHENSEIFVYRSGQAVGKCSGLNELAPLIKICLWLPAIDAFDYFLNLHAGVIGCRDGCVLLPAAAGSGKSTTTAALVHNGFPYLSDEVALLTADCTIRALPLAVCFKDSGWDIAGRYFNEIDSLAAHLRGDRKIVKYLSLQERFCADAAQRYPVKAIIFPKYTPESVTSMQPLPKTQALDRMFRECVSMPADLTEDRVSRLVAWIKGVACYSVEFSDLDTAVSAIRDVLEE
jgi:hypothetical protein